MKTNLLLGSALALVITGVGAQTIQQGSGQSVERIKDAVGHALGVGEAPKAVAKTASEARKPASETPRRDVRVVYPNTQQAGRKPDEASRRAPGDVTPIETAQQPVTESAAPAATPPQTTAPTPAAQTATPAPAAQSAPPASPPPAMQAAQPPATPPSTAQQGAPATAATTVSEASQGNRSSGIVALSTEQQTKVGQSVARYHIKPLTNVSFSMAVGTAVPKSVQLRALPSDLVSFIPQYRGYSYLVVEEQVVIVDPATHDVVAIVPFTQAPPETRLVETGSEKGKQPVAQKPMVSRPVSLKTDTNKVSRRHGPEQRKRTQTVTREVREERRVPRTVTVEEYDEPVYRPAPRPRGFFGFFRNDDDDADD